MSWDYHTILSNDNLVSCGECLGSFTQRLYFFLLDFRLSREAASREAVSRAASDLVIVIVW